MNDYLSKPVSPDALAERLEKWLGAGNEPGLPNLGIEDIGGANNTASADSKAEAVIFDRKAFLDRLMGDEALAVTVMRGFLADIPEQIQALNTFVTEGKAPEAGAQAHQIKSAAGYIGSAALQETAQAIEKAGKSGNIPALIRLVPEMEKRFEKLKAAMEASDP